jgi:hypothetical protein
MRAKQRCGSPPKAAPGSDRAIAPDVVVSNDGSVTKLALSIDEEQAFDGLPALVDALEKGGVVDRKMLDHYRNPGPHARGCWVVDQLLGKS